MGRNAITGENVVTSSKPVGDAGVFTERLIAFPQRGTGLVLWKIQHVTNHTTQTRKHST